MTVRISPHRKSQFFITTILTFGLGATAALAQNDSMPSQAEMWEMIQQQQQQIEALKKQIEGQPTGDALEAVTVSGDIRAKQAKTEETLTRLEAKIAETDMKVEATGACLKICKRPVPQAKAGGTGLQSAAMANCTIMAATRMRWIFTASFFMLATSSMTG